MGVGLAFGRYLGYGTVSGRPTLVRLLCDLPVLGASMSSSSKYTVRASAFRGIEAVSRRRFEAKVDRVRRVFAATRYLRVNVPPFLLLPPFNREPLLTEHTHCPVLTRRARSVELRSRKSGRDISVGNRQVFQSRREKVARDGTAAIAFPYLNY